MAHWRNLGRWTVGGSLAAAGAALMAPAAHAASANGRFLVQLEIVNACMISPGAGSAGAITVSCTENTPYSIELSRSVLDDASGNSPAARTRSGVAQPELAMAASPRTNRSETVTVTIQY
ncbi:MAG TPA: hypothetical protein VI168_04110 [Croceibacterium sp.]